MAAAWRRASIPEAAFRELVLKPIVIDGGGDEISRLSYSFSLVEEPRRHRRNGRNEGGGPGDRRQGKKKRKHFCPPSSLDSLFT